MGRSYRLLEDELEAAGYRASVLGKAHRWDYGVAILSRTGLPEPNEIFRGLPGAESEGARLLTVEIDGLWLSSIYAPYSARDNVPAIERRVAWLQCLREHIKSEGYGSRDSLLCGDFNVKADVDLGLKGNYTKHEQRELDRLRELGFADLYRKAHPGGKAGHTFGFHRKPEGTSRLHLILGSQSVAERLRNACVDKLRIREEARPLIVELDGISR